MGVLGEPELYKNADAELNKFLFSLRHRRQRIAFIYAANIATNDSDIYSVNSGVPNSGKSTKGINESYRVIKYLREICNKDTDKFSLKDDVIYTDELNVQDLSNADYRHKVIDDGYMQALNLDNTSTIANLIKVVNSTRNHHHLMEWNFQKPTRSAKGLFERFNIFTFKPRIRSPWTILMAMSPMMILTSDPWYLNELLGSKGQVSDYTIKNWLKLNPNLVCDYTEVKMPPRRWAIYQKYKNEAQARYAKDMQYAKSLKQIDTGMMEEVYQKLKAGVITKKDISEYLTQVYHYTQAQVMKFITKYDEFERMKKIMEYKKGQGGFFEIGE